MKWQTFFFSTLSLATAFFISAHAQNSNAGIVNFTTCITKSKYGLQEQEAFEEAKNKMTSIMADLEKQLKDIHEKFQDPEFVDSLSPEAEQEMKSRFQSLNEELSRYQNQYYQVMNQANMKLIQLMNAHVSEAAEVVAKKEHLSFILNKDACFFYKPEKDVTAIVITEMDKKFDKNEMTQKTSRKEQSSKQALNSGN